MVKIMREIHDNKEFCVFGSGGRKEKTLFEAVYERQIFFKKDINF